MSINEYLEINERDSEDEHKSIYCDELFSSSATGEDSIRCHMCCKWAHGACTELDESAKKCMFQI